MKEKSVYLKPNVVLEPLVDKWYAWPHLISPATAAMNIVGRHLKIMNSFIQAPHIHRAAVLNPKMRGGPFMELEEFKKKDVEALKAETISKRKDQIEFANAIHALDKMLKEHAKGYSLESLYAKVPEILRGYVELVYDLNNNPSFRFFEALLYKSKYYDESAQSVALWLTENDERAFVLSTPKVASPGVLNIELPFRSTFIDVISSMKRKAKPLSYIKEFVNLKSDEEQSLFNSFFTEEAPEPYKPYKGDGIRTRYFGHAAILVETKDITILVDPIISYYGYQSEVNRFSDADLPDVIDYVLITHNHQDHVLFETLLPLRHKIRNLVLPMSTSGSLQDPSLKLMFKALGFNNIVEIDVMESIDFEDCTITGVPFIGEHSDLNIQSKICHHIRIADLSILFAADSCNIEPKLYEHVKKAIGEIDVIFIGMECDGAPLSWLYGPLLTEELPRDKDNSRRLAGSNFERAKAIVDLFNPFEVYVYAMGQEPWIEFISSIKYTDESNPIVASNKLIANCAKNGKVAERLFGEKELHYRKWKEIRNPFNWDVSEEYLAGMDMPLPIEHTSAL